jgi:lysosomal Pro-X carboxypeptidase
MGPFRSAAAAPFRARRSATTAPPTGSDRRTAAANATTPDPSDLIASCQLRWRNATLDHFSFADSDDEKFPQRFYVCDKHWRRALPAPTTAADGNATAGNDDDPALGSAGPIFFYAGNEADVLLYLNHTGLMWENAERFGALLVFAEHRYYGESRPLKKEQAEEQAACDVAANTTTTTPALSASARRLRARLAHLSAAQAMADYAELLRELRLELRVPADTPVACFGGSYGGMLASWMRMKHPDAIDAAVASSAPIFNFAGLDPPYPADAFAAAVTADATPEVGGAAAACRDNVRSAWRALAFLSGHSEEKHKKEGGVSAAGIRGRSADRRRLLAARAMRLCGADEEGGGDGPASYLARRSGFEAARSWLSSAWDYLAMGDFPYESAYMTNGVGLLPAFPVRAACEKLADPSLAAWEHEEEEEEGEEGSGGGGDDARTRGAVKLLDAMTQAAGVFFNYTGADVECYEPAGGQDPDVLLPPDEENGGEGERQGAAATAAPVVSARVLALARAFLPDADVRVLEKQQRLQQQAAREASSSSSNGGDDPTTLDAFLWDWQYCSEMLMPFGKNGVTDFYWPEPFSLEDARKTCRQSWAGLEPRVGWAVANYGGRGALRSATRITFPSGALDPWRPGSPLEVPQMVEEKVAAGGEGGGGGGKVGAGASAASSASATLAPRLDAFTIPSGAHHIDTFFSDPRDPPDVTAARRRILDLLSRWLDEARAERAEQRRRELAGGEKAAAAAGERERQQQQHQEQQI